jgi:DNA polymerase III epsilon subunit-like protein
MDMTVNLEAGSKPSQSHRASAEEILDRLGTVCVIDVESSSLSPEEGRVVELGLVRFKGATMAGAFSTIVRGAIEPTRLHNEVPLDLIREAPAFADVAPVVQSYLENSDVLLGQNIQFDVRWLAKEFARTGTAVGMPPALDLIPAAKAAFPGRSHYDLDSIVTMTGTTVHRPRHRALQDCLTEHGAFLDVVAELVRSGRMKSTEDLEPFLNQGPRTRRRPEAAPVQDEIAAAVERLADRASQRELMSQEDEQDEAILADYAALSGDKLVRGDTHFATVGAYEVWRAVSQDEDSTSVLRGILTEAGVWNAVSELNGYHLARAIAKGLIPETIKKKIEEFGGLKKIRRVKLFPAQ